MTTRRWPVSRITKQRRECPNRRSSWISCCICSITRPHHRGQAHACLSILTGGEPPSLDLLVFQRGVKAPDLEALSRSRSGFAATSQKNLYSRRHRHPLSIEQITPG